MIDMIGKKQIEARVNDEISRMKQAAIAIDFYNGQQRYYMEQVVAAMYPVTWQDMYYYISTCDLTREVVDQKSILFQSPPEIEIDTTNTLLQERFKQMLADADLHKKLIASDRMAELTGKVGITLHWHEAEKRVVLDVITPDKCFVVPDEQDPTKPKIVYYRIGVDNDPRTTAPLNVYGKWTIDSYSEVVLSDQFKELKETKAPIKNIYGRIPVVWLSPYIEIDSFWIDRGYPLIEGNININLREGNYDMGLDFQSFSLLVTKGLGKTNDIITGPTRRIDLPSGEFGGNSDSQAYYITPDAKLTEVGAAIQNKKISKAKESGLSADAFNQDASKISSGYQLRLTEKQNEENNNLKKTIYRQPIMDLIENMMICYSAESSDFKFPTDADIYFNYIDKQSANNPIETATLHITKINAGLMSTADAIREMNPDLSQEEAIAEAKRIKAEQQEINGGIRPMTAQDLGGESV
jgi:hypothetical protein